MRRDSGCRRRKRLSATLRAGTIESALSTLSADSFSAQARGTMAPHHKAGMRCDQDHMRWLDHEIHHAFGTTTRGSPKPDAPVREKHCTTSDSRYIDLPRREGHP